VNYDQHFNNSTHDRGVRLAMMKLATAAIDLSGFATWREWQWTMRETGLRLLTWGLAQLWEGMSDQERSSVRSRLQRTHKAVGWPGDPTTGPTSYGGPEEIPLADQYRIVSNYVSCYRDYLNDLQNPESVCVQQGQEEFLRRATLEQFVLMAERAAKALRAMAKREYDTPVEWAKLYTKAYWPLACFRRGQEIQPLEPWPAAALHQRQLLAGAADIVWTWIGGTPEAKAALKPQDADKAFEEFIKATSLLRHSMGGQFIGRLLAGPDDVEPSPRDTVLVEAHADVPLDQSTLAAAQGMLAHINSLAGTNTAMRNLVVDLGARHAGGASPRSGGAETWEVGTAGNHRSDPALAFNLTEPTRKRSTERGEGRAKLIAALTKHHQYADGGCPNLEPIGNNELAKAAGVSPSTASTFFNNEFEGHTKYKALCRDSGLLVTALKLLNN
jgi:hypothetical protein